MKVKSSIQLALIAPFSLLLADSLVLSVSQVSYHYNKSSSYINSAASLGETAAIYELYQVTGNKNWLTKAAKLGHAEAAWQMYLLGQSSVERKSYIAHQENNIWFELALRNNHPGALIQQLETLVISQHWKQASGQVFKIEQHINDTSNSKIETGLLYALTNAIEVGVLGNSIVLPETYQKSIKRLKARLEKSQESNALNINRPALLETFKPSCEVKVLVIANSIEATLKTEQLITAFHHALPDTKTTLCFSNVNTNYQLNALCEKSKSGLLSCKSSGIKSLVEDSASSKSVALSDKKVRLLIVANAGKANSRGPVIFMDKNDNAQVLLHEVGHWLNLYDEYQLKPAYQNIYCKEQQPTLLGENLMVAPLKYNVDTLQTHFKRSLWPVDTCKGTNNQAYKWIPELTPMEYLDVQLTPAMQQFFNEPKLNPFHTDLQTYFR